MFIFGGCYTSNERYNDTYYLKLRIKYFIKRHSNGSNHPIKNQSAHRKTQWVRLAVLSPELITQWHTTKTRLLSSEDLEEWTTKERPSMTYTSWIWIRSSGASQKSKETLQRQEEATLPVCLLKKISWWSLEAGTLCSSSTTSSFTISRPRLGPIHRSPMRLRSGILEES